MEAIKKSKERLRAYPLLLAECRQPATRYARCVALKDNVLKDDCAKEFAKFKQCLVAAAVKAGTKL